MAETARNPLKVVLVVDEDQVLKDYQTLLIERLAHDDVIDLVGKVRGTSARANPRFSAFARMVLSVERMTMRRFVPVLGLTSMQTLFDELSLMDAKADTALADLAIVLGKYALKPDELSIARYGEWSLSFSGAADPECVAMCPEISTRPYMDLEITCRTTQNPSAATLRRTRYNPKPGAILSGAFVAEKSTLFLHHTVRSSADGLMPKLEKQDTLDCPKPPHFGDTLVYCGRFLRISVEKLLEKVRAQHDRARSYWRIAHGNGAITDFHPRTSIDLSREAHTMADPFLFEYHGDLWLFYEAMGANEDAGWIEARRLSADNAEPSVVALKCDYHLSFPHVFQVDDQIFMLPETQQSNRLEIWRATDFPHQWTLHATAFEGEKLAESSLFQADDGQWWLLTNRSDHRAFQDHSSELYLYAVDGPDLTSIRPHPRNPVVFGADVARNAGAIIRHEGRSYRPAQNNCFGIYGYGLNIMEILRLDDSGYEERLVRQFTPGDKPGSMALHHLSVVRDHYVFDWGGR